MAAFGCPPRITQELSSDKIAEEAARQRVDQALGLYGEYRNNLADFLISRQLAGKPAVSVGSQPQAHLLHFATQRSCNPLIRHDGAALNAKL